jgi:group I intron endonuclease
MILNINDKNKAGIYCIKNTVNNKVYIGKSINIYFRIKTHITNLNRRIKKQENEYLINSWHKYGKSFFEYTVLEYLEKDDIILAEKELYWIQYFNSTNSKFGYNLRLDSQGKCIIHEDTRKKLKLSSQQRNRSVEEKEKTSNFFKEFWKNNPEIKEEMRQKVKLTKQNKYKFLKLDDNNNILEEFNSVEEIIQRNPTYKWQNIYSVCNGYKKRMYGYKWKKEFKI